MIEPKVTKSRITVWRLSGKGEEGFIRETATLYERVIGSDVVYDDPLPEKNYRAKCDVCLAQEQGYSCERLTVAPGPYELEGGCMDCEHHCNKTPIHIGIRNYCADHIYLLNRKMGIVEK
jgi:hypothetical protein